MKIELLNSNGEHVAHTELPPFKRAPGVVIWGDRVFSRLIDLEAAPEAKPLYREAFAYVIPDGDARTPPLKPRIITGNSPCTTSCR